MSYKTITTKIKIIDIDPIVKINEPDSERKTYGYVLFNHQNHLIIHSGYGEEILIFTYFSIHPIYPFVINKSPIVEIR